MHRHVNFVLSTPQYCPYLAVSLYTLRKHWTGNVVIHAWPESYGFCERLARDPRLYCHVRLAEPKFVGRNAQFLQKIELAIASKEGTFLYLDSDIVVADSLLPLFDAAAHYGFIATQFGDWTTQTQVPHWTNTKITTVAGRLDRLRAFPAIDQRLVEEAIAESYPSVNGGVFAADWGVIPLQVWLEWTQAAITTRIPDELVLHLLQIRFPELIRVMPGRYNRSPVYHKHIEDYAICHFHGNSAVRSEKGSAGARKWKALFLHCLEENLGGMMDWYDQCGNKHLNYMMGVAA